jgi:hypothetical protein
VIHARWKPEARTSSLLEGSGAGLPAAISGLESAGSGGSADRRDRADRPATSSAMIMATP